MPNNSNDPRQIHATAFGIGVLGSVVTGIGGLLAALTAYDAPVLQWEQAPA